MTRLVYNTGETIRDTLNLVISDEPNITPLLFSLQLKDTYSLV